MSRFFQHADNECIYLVLHRDVAKNALLRWRAFIYWTFLGVFDAVVFFFGAYFLFDNTIVTSNGQVSVGFGQSIKGRYFNVKCNMNIVLIVFFKICSTDDNCFMSYGEMDGLSVWQSLSYAIGIMCSSKERHRTRWNLGESIASEFT